MPSFHDQFMKIMPSFHHPEKKYFENIMDKEENAGNQHFLLFPQCFPPYERKIAPSEPH